MGIGGLPPTGRRRGCGSFGRIPPLPPPVVGNVGPPSSGRGIGRIGPILAPVRHNPKFGSTNKRGRRLFNKNTGLC